MQALSRLSRYKKFIAPFFLLTSIICSFVITSTYDDGDSIMHYLISRYAYLHPEKFFYHWGKPMFTLLSSPFTYFLHWKGMVLFNIVIVFLSSLYSYKVAQILNFKPAILVVFIFYLAPKSFLIQYSGLTEPLFELFLIVPIYYWLIDKKNLSIILLSFILFSRSEGMIICIIWCAYLITIRDFKRIPLLFTGLIIYSIAGHFMLGNFWWYFTDNPYGSKSEYGHGEWAYYVIQYPGLIGVPIFILMLLGILNFLHKLLYVKSSWTEVYFKERFFLVYGCFVGFFFFHAFAWKYGLFASFGMTRVLIGLMPPMAIICMDGIVLLKRMIPNQKYYLIAKWSIIAAIVIYPFTGAKTGGFHWSEDFQLNYGQKVQKLACDWARSANLLSKPVYSSAPFICVCLDIDPDNPASRIDVGFINYGDPDKGAIIFHDAWYSVMESKVSLNSLIENEKYDHIREVVMPPNENPKFDTYSVNIFLKK